MRAAFAAVFAFALAFGALASLEERAFAQAPPSGPELEARALVIERQLLCPQCTNERLDVCDLAICLDMKRLIRQRLVAGDSQDTILLFFSQRYGERVLADLPKHGFNLWLWGWVAASMVAVAGLGGWWLRSQRGHARSVEARALIEADERWLDEQLRDEPARQGG